VKPSPVASILLFAGALFLVIGLLGRAWFVMDNDVVSQHVGPVWGEVCFNSEFRESRAGEDRCETFHFLKDLDKGDWGGLRLMFFLFVLMALTGMVMTPIAGILLLKKQKSAMSLMTLIFAGGALLLILIVFLYEMADSKHFELPSYGFFIYFLGSVLAVVGSIMAMVRAKGMPAGVLPRPYPQPGYPPQPMPQQYGSQPYQQPQQPHLPAAQPAQSPYAPGAQPQAQAPYNPQPQAQQVPAHPVCGTPMTWAAQYNRWFCPRCNQYG